MNRHFLRRSFFDRPLTNPANSTRPEEAVSLKRDFVFASSFPPPAMTSLPPVDGSAALRLSSPSGLYAACRGKAYSLLLQFKVHKRVEAVWYDSGPSLKPVSLPAHLRYRHRIVEKTMIEFLDQKKWDTQDGILLQMPQAFVLVQLYYGVLMP
jgi:hypothetical protein